MRVPLLLLTLALPTSAEPVLAKEAQVLSPKSGADDAEAVVVVPPAAGLVIAKKLTPKSEADDAEAAANRIVAEAALAEQSKQEQEKKAKDVTEEKKETKKAEPKQKKAAEADITKTALATEESKEKQENEVHPAKDVTEEKKETKKAELKQKKKKQKKAAEAEITETALAVEQSKEEQENKVHSAKDVTEEKKETKKAEPKEKKQKEKKHKEEESKDEKNASSAPFSDLEPFGREEKAQQLTESSIKESNKMVDQIEKAEVAETKRSVFRALTRLRGAAVASFDGVAKSQVGNLQDYAKEHQYRDEHEVKHLADEEDDVEAWAFPTNADFLQTAHRKPIAVVPQ